MMHRVGVTCAAWCILTGGDKVKHYFSRQTKGLDFYRSIIVLLLGLSVLGQADPPEKTDNTTEPPPVSANAKKAVYDHDDLEQLRKDRAAMREIRNELTSEFVGKPGMSEEQNQEALDYIN